MSYLFIFLRSFFSSFLLFIGILFFFVNFHLFAQYSSFFQSMSSKLALGKEKEWSDTNSIKNKNNNLPSQSAIEALFQQPLKGDLVNNANLVAQQDHVLSLLSLAEYHQLIYQLIHTNQISLLKYICQQGIKRFPRDYLLNCYYIFILIIQSTNMEAQLYIKQALILWPHDSLLMAFQGLVFQQEGHLQSASLCLKQSLKVKYRPWVVQQLRIIHFQKYSN